MTDTKVCHETHLDAINAALANMAMIRITYDALAEGDILAEDWPARDENTAAAWAVKECMDALHSELAAVRKGGEA